MQKKIRHLLVTLAMATASATAAAAPPDPVRENAVMLYFHKSFGTNARGRELPLAYGLRLQQSSPWVGAPRVDLVDLDFSQNLRASLLNGALQLNAFGDKPLGEKSSSEGSSAEEEEDLPESSRENKGKIVVFSLVGLAAAACAFRVGLCKKSDGPDEYEEPPPTPTPGKG